MEQAVEADTRTILLSRIEDSPGIRYRELLRMTGLVNGVLTYH
jgi:predicted transcriptional regulator